MTNHNQLSDKIMKAIEEQLPAAQFDAVKKLFMDLEVTQKQLCIVKDALSKRDVKLGELTKFKLEHCELDEREAVLNTEIKTLIRDQHALDIENAKARMLREMVAYTKEVLQIVFRNSEVRKSIHGTVPVKEPDGYSVDGTINVETTEVKE